MWPLEDGTYSEFEGRITAFKKKKKRKFRIEFSDGDTMWSSLSRKKIRFEMLGLPEKEEHHQQQPPSQQHEEAYQEEEEEEAGAVAARPYYIGSTDPGLF